MNANTALKINDAIDQAIRCGESVDAVLLQVRNALTRAVEERAAAQIRAIQEAAAPVILARGTRVRLRHHVDRYPHFIAVAGSIGTVVECDEQLLRVRLDEYLPGAEDWDNEVHWFDPNDNRERDLEVID